MGFKGSKVQILSSRPEIPGAAVKAAAPFVFACSSLFRSEAYVRRGNAPCGESSNIQKPKHWLPRLGGAIRADFPHAALHPVSHALARG